MEINSPNFLIIGAPRSGTDFLSYILKQHPDICFAQKREVHFFDRNIDKGLLWYQSFFLKCKSQLIGEKTANYFVNKNSSKRIFETFPEIKLIISLRNPVYRAFSHYRNWLGNGAINKNTSFRDCLINHPEIIDIGYYVSHLENYLRYFQKKNIHILFFENLIDNPQKETNKILNFLGNKVQYQFSNKKKNVSPPIAKFRLLHGKLGQIIYKHIFSKLNQKKINFFYHKNKTISKEDYNYLKKKYTEKNEDLFKLLKTKPNWNDENIHNS